MAEAPTAASIPEATKPINRVNILNAAAYVVNAIMTWASMFFPNDNAELSEKYQTIITPAGSAFSIWGIIFTWELVFVIAQFFPRYRDSKLIAAVSPWWWSACLFQSLWTPFFAIEWLEGALAAMLCILISLAGLLIASDFVANLSFEEEALFLAPFGVHCGWIICASALNMNVVFVGARWDQSALLAAAIVSLAVIFSGASLFAVALRYSNVFVPLVVAWASFWINQELEEASILLDNTRDYYIPWNTTSIEAIRSAACGLSVAALVLAGVAVVMRYVRGRVATAASVYSADAQPEEAVIESQ